MTLESIEKLRNRVNPMMPLNAEIIANEIEREIAERFIELPVDADGVPIRVGDELYNGEVIAFGGLAEGGVVFVHRGFEDGNYILEAFASNVTHHVKPRTVEDVLRDFLDEKVYTSKTYERYADELRGLIKEGGE